MVNDTISDDLRQAYVVMKNEFTKTIRGRKILLFVGLIALILVLMTFMPYVFGDGLSSDPAEAVSMYLYFASFVVLLAAALFASGLIVSEYEERTALILFTKPVKKWSMFLGKFISAFALSVGFMLIYYGVTALVSLVVTGSVDVALFTSLGLAILYSFAACGVAILISAVMKKSSISTLLAFVVLLMILPMMSMLMSTSFDPWWMLDQAGNALAGVLPPSEYITSMTSSEIWRAAGVMVGWGAVTSIIAYFLFKRREF